MDIIYDIQEIGHLFRLLFHLWLSGAQDITTDESFNIVKELVVRWKS